VATMCEGHKFEGDKSETNSKEGQRCVRVTSLKEIKVKRTARKDKNV